MPSKTNINEPQYQMSDYLFCEIMKYLKNNNMKFSELCKTLRIPQYYLKKVMDRNIKMHTFKSVFIKIANYCDISLNGTHQLYKQQPTRVK